MTNGKVKKIRIDGREELSIREEEPPRLVR